MSDPAPENTWPNIIRFLETDESTRRLLPVALLASQDEALKTLHPYTSHLALGFSRKKTYPFSKHFPFVTARVDGSFDVITPKQELLASGSAENALAVIKAINSCPKEDDHGQSDPETPQDLNQSSSSMAAKYVLGWAILEHGIRRAYKVKGMDIPKKLLFKALADQKQGRIETLLKLRNGVVHGDGRAAGKITLRHLLEVGAFQRAIERSGRSVPIVRKKKAIYNQQRMREKVSR